MGAGGPAIFADLETDQGTFDFELLFSSLQSSL
jgi:hypothetical protein